MNQKTLKRVSYGMLVGPALLIYLAVIVYPVIFSAILSFTDWNGFGPKNFVGIVNYIDMWKSDIFRHGFRNNMLIVAVSIFGQIPLGFLFAYILYRKMVKAGSFFQAMIFLPITISLVVVAILFNRFFGPYGIFTSVVRLINGDPRWIWTIAENKQLAIVPILIVILWYYTGTFMVMFLANLQKINDSILEAAVIDGANEFQILIKIILPHMLGIIMTTAIFAFSGSLRSFGLVFAMTAGGPAHYTEVISIFMYVRSTQFHQYGIGNAIAMFIIFVSVVFVKVLENIFGYFERKYN